MAHPGSSPELSPPLRPAVAALAARLGVEQSGEHVAKLDAALAHRSWCSERKGVSSNERLEFLGDAVLELVVTNHVFRNHPSLSEGDMAKIRADVVSTATLARVAAELRLGDALLLGKGEEASGGRQKASILADALEAVIGAVYLAAGWPVVARMVLDLLGESIDEAVAGPGGRDFKSQLQELTTQRGIEVPRYRVHSSGPDHERVFSAEVRVGGRVLGTGSGRSKKLAEQAAAEVAWGVVVDAQPGNGNGETRGDDA